MFERIARMLRPSVLVQVCRRGGGRDTLDTWPVEGSIAGQLRTLVDLQRQGLVRHIGLSNVTPRQVEEGGGIAEIICVQNQNTLAHRDDDALIDTLAEAGITYVPFFPLGGFSPLQASALSDVHSTSGPRRCRSR
ncbi:MAG TPA: aldo/keto reductase [Sphingomonas sp.]|nr:aldo/keto reductase [Sphingomonas sp.]